jgi:hypothetical protein
MTEPDKREKRRRAAIASIMRRRNRSRKPRANSGASETGWAEYSSVTLTPSSDRSWSQILGLFLLLLLALGVLFVAFTPAGAGLVENAMGWADSRKDHSVNPQIRGGFLNWLLPLALYTVLALTVLATIFVSVAGLIRVIRSNLRR